MLSSMLTKEQELSLEQLHKKTKLIIKRNYFFVYIHKRFSTMPQKSKRDMKAFHQEALDDIHGRKPLPESKPKKSRKKKDKKSSPKYETFDGQQLLIMGFQKQEIMRLKREQINPEKLVSSLKEKAGKSQVAIMTPGHISLIGISTLIKRAPQLGTIKQLKNDLVKGNFLDLGYAKIKNINDIIPRDFMQVHSLADKIGHSYYLAGKTKQEKTVAEIEHKKIDVDEDNLKNKQTKVDLMKEIEEKIHKKAHNKPISVINKDGTVQKMGQKQVAEKLNIHGFNATEVRKNVEKTLKDGPKVKGGMLFAWGAKIGSDFKDTLQNHLKAHDKPKLENQNISKQAEEPKPEPKLTKNKLDLENEEETIEFNKNNLKTFLDENNDDDDYDDSFGKPI